MKFLVKILLAFACLSAVTVAYFAENIQGYYRFKETCEKEAGLHLDQKLERGVGWKIAGGSIVETALIVHRDEVAFVRYKNSKDGLEYDVYKFPQAP